MTGVKLEIRLIAVPKPNEGKCPFPLTTFFLLAYGWTWLCWWSVLAVPTSSEWLATLGQFGPVAAAVIVTSATGGRAGLRELLSSLMRWRVHPVWYGVSFLLLPALMLAAIVLYASSQGTILTLRFQGTLATLPAHFIYTLLLCGPLGEEPGWRGFALPRLQAKYGAVGASLVLGLFGAGWHLPLWWIVQPPPCPFPLFVIGAVLLTFLFTWLFNHTRGSVLISLIFHASLSTASVRLPEVPAYHLWVLSLLAAVMAILFVDGASDEHRKQSDEQLSDGSPPAGL